MTRDEFSEVTGATWRQINHWRSSGVFDRYGLPRNPGAGTTIDYPDELVEAVSIAARVSVAIAGEQQKRHGLPLDVVAELVDEVAAGADELELAGGIWVRWAPPVR